MKLELLCVETKILLSISTCAATSWEPHADFVNVTIGDQDRRAVGDFGSARRPLALINNGGVTIPTVGRCRLTLSNPH